MAAVFSAYEPHASVRDLGQPHPGNIVESAPLAAVSLPDDVPYQLTSCVARLGRTGALSSLQLEGVRFACARHQTILPDGQRAGFFIGDSAGVVSSVSPS